MRWLLILELALSGCSFTLSGPAAHRPRGQPPACDTSKSMVVLDSLVATGLGIAAIGEAGGSDSATALVPLAFGAAFLGAAVYGYRLTNHCEQANEAFRNEQIVDAKPLLEEPAPVAHLPVVTLPSAAPSAPSAPLPPVAVVAPGVVVAPGAPAPVVAPRPQPPTPPPAPDDRWPAFWRVIP